MELADAIAAGDLLAVARCYRAVGLSVVPVHADGSKAPKLVAWTRYGDEPPSDVELVEWFGRGRPGGLGIPGGPASGNLSVLDFETAAVWEEWLGGLTKEQRAEVESCPLARTPRGGAHLYARLEYPTRGVTLAEEPAGVDPSSGRVKTKTLIETRAHGEQVLAPGCPPECHPERKPYRWERLAWVGGGPGHVVPAETWVSWLELAASLTRVERRHAERRPDTRDRRSVSADDPGTDFNRRGTWEEAGLYASGAAVVRDYGDDRATVRRPGKDRGISGTVGLVSSAANGWPLFHCFTSNWPPFESRGNYDRFGVFARLACGGDFKAAAKELRAMGYGKQDGPRPSVVWRHTNDGAGVAGRGFKWASELSAPERADDWIWEGYLPRGGVTLLSALWKIGKTTLLSHFLRACGSGGEFFGQKLKASRVLYVSEESERHWVRRRDALGLGDGTGFYLQPFPTRPAADGWQGFVAQLTADVAAHRFDLVVFDTLAKLWPVTEENDAGAVDAALMPLWDICRAGAGVLLIHHLRKSGGGEYTGSRGSGALSAFPDILVELTRFDASDPKCKKRVLRAKGRYDETPDELVIELVDGNYVHVPEPGGDAPPAATVGGTPAEPPPPGEEGRVVRVLAESPNPWMKSDDVRAALAAKNWGMRDADVSVHLSSLVSRSEVVISGKLNSKKTPRVYALASRVSSHSAPGSSGNEMREADGEERTLE